VNRHRQLLGVVAVGALLAAGCAEYRIERNGKDAGEALCDLKDADSQEEVDAAMDDVQKEIDDAQRIVGRPVSEDVDDIEENVADLAAHNIDDQEVLAEQDIAAIRRNVEAATSRSRAAVERFYQGVVQGLGDCSD
jgi:septal ring-binding cell division protein DamX